MLTVAASACWRRSRKSQRSHPAVVEIFQSVQKWWTKLPKKQAIPQGTYPKSSLKVAKYYHQRTFRGHSLKTFCLILSPVLQKCKSLKFSCQLGQFSVRTKVVIHSNPSNTCDNISSCYRKSHHCQKDSSSWDHECLHKTSWKARTFQTVTIKQFNNYFSQISSLCYVFSHIFTQTVTLLRWI